MKTVFKYNPFSGVSAEEVGDIIVPILDVASLLEKIRSREPMAIELIGRQGRGKTTHLIHLHQQMTEYPFFNLNQSTELSQILEKNSDVLFIDGIHHLTFIERIKLFKESRVVVYTTHWSRTIDCFIASKELHSFRFKGIDRTLLSSIIEKRLSVAGKENFESDKISNREIDSLIKNFGDNYRGIINHLFDQYQ